MSRVMMLGLLACVALPGFAHRIRVDFDHTTQFSRYRTYRLVSEADAPPQNALFPNQLMQERIANTIEEALAARGFKRVKTGGDLLISYRVEVTATPQFTTFSDGGWPGWGWGGGCCWGAGWGTGISTTTVETFYEGTLVVDMVDANQQKLVFQGTSTQSISSRPARNSRRLARAVNEIFEKYPPRP